MSIRTNPMKAVPVLLKRVEMARNKFHKRGRDESFDGKLEKLTRELKKIEDVFIKVKKNQGELLDTLHEVDGHLRKLDKTRLDQDMDGICKRIKGCAHKLLPMDSFDDDSYEEKSGETVQLSDDQSSIQQYNNQLVLPQLPHINPNLLQHMKDFQLRDCLLSLLIFPVNAVIKKTQAIYLWIGLHLLYEKIGGKMAEEVGEDVIDKLLELNVIVAYGNGKCPIVNKFKLNPQIRPQLESLVQREKAERLGSYLEMPVYLYRNYLLLSPPGLLHEQQKVTLDHEVQPNHDVYNINASYLNFGSKLMDKLQNSYVLQLGRWQDSPCHHIEVGGQEFLKDLRNHKYLTYPSLRGISRIFELPPSIAQIESLPDDILSMTNLTHLVLSQSYLLDGMPKGIEKLTKLQVLKGFIIGSSRKTPCTISDLANLQRLRRLSIHIGSEAVIKDGEFESLPKFSRLEHLKISWGVSDTKYSDIQIKFPSSLKKLHLQGFRGQIIPKWLKPSKLLGD